MTIVERRQVPGVLKRPENKKPLERYGIDSHSLAAAGLAKHHVTAIYRALYAHSYGLFAMLDDVAGYVSRASDKDLRVEADAERERRAVLNPTGATGESAELLQGKVGIIKTNIWRTF